MVFCGNNIDGIAGAFDFVGFDLASLSATYFFFRLILSYLLYIYGFLFTGCRVIVPLAFVVCPLITEVDLGICVASYWEGLVPALWWVELNLFPLMTLPRGGSG